MVLNGAGMGGVCCGTSWHWYGQCFSYYWYHVVGPFAVLLLVFACSWLFVAVPSSVGIGSGVGRACSSLWLLALCSAGIGPFICRPVHCCASVYIMLVQVLVCSLVGHSLFCPLMFIHLWHLPKLLAGCTLVAVWLANLESDGMVSLPWLVYCMVGTCIAVSTTVKYRVSNQTQALWRLPLMCTSQYSSYVSIFNQHGMFSQV